jgi:hypothetical protein
MIVKTAQKGGFFVPGTGPENAQKNGMPDTMGAQWGRKIRFLKAFKYPL